MSAKLAGAVITAAITIAVVGCAGSSRLGTGIAQARQPTAPATPHPSYLKADRFDGTDQLKVINLSATGEITVNIVGMDVDITCAKRWHITTTPDSYRVALLEHGCATLNGKQAPVDAELKAEGKARDARLGVWQATVTTTPTTDSRPPPPPPGPSLIDRFFAWLGSQWYNSVSLMVGILGLSWVSAMINGWRHRRRVDVVLTGMPGAGKTDLWNAWRMDAAVDTGTGPTIGAHGTNRLEQLEHGKRIFVPRLIDAAGSDPAALLNFVRKSPRRRKRVLIFVVAPTPADNPPASGYDDNYVRDQNTYSVLPRAILGLKDKRIRPAMVVLVLTKFDLLSNAKPDDTTSSEQVAQARRVFRRLIDSFQADCTENNIPFKFVIGSAKQNWGIEDLQKEIKKGLSNGARKG